MVLQNNASNIFFEQNWLHCRHFFPSNARKNIACFTSPYYLFNIYVMILHVFFRHQLSGGIKIYENFFFISIYSLQYPILEKEDSTSGFLLRGEGQDKKEKRKYLLISGFISPIVYTYYGDDTGSIWSKKNTRTEKLSLRKNHDD